MSEAVRSSRAMASWDDLQQAERVSYMRCLAASNAMPCAEPIIPGLPAWAVAEIKSSTNAVIVKVIDAGEAPPMVADPTSRHLVLDFAIRSNFGFLYDCSQPERTLAALMGMRSLPEEVRRIIMTAQ